MEFPSNSHKKTEARPTGEDRVPLEPVVTGKVIKKKHSLGARFKQVFLGADAKSTGQYIVVDVLVPAFRNMLFDAVQNGVERFIYGDARRGARLTGGGSRQRTTYNQPVARPSMPSRSYMLPDQPPRQIRQDNDLIFATNEDAINVLDRLNEIADRWGQVTVADFHEAAGQPTTYIDNKWGWQDLRYAKVRQTRDGFVLDLPPIEPVEN